MFYYIIIPPSSKLWSYTLAFVSVRIYRNLMTGLTYHAYNLFCDRLLGMVALTQQRETPLKIFIRLSLEPFKAMP